VDGETAYYVETVRGVENFLAGLRNSIKDRSFCPLPVRERMIPKAGGKKRRLGIATVRDRVVQASLKLVLEPIFEAEFLPCSYGFRPNHRAQDAVAEVRHLTSHSYEWVVEGDIKACFDEISHPALMDRVRRRIGDRRVLALVKAFLKAGILGEDRVLRETSAGTPQGSILSPLLSNVALSVLDEFIAQGPGGPASTFNDRQKRRRRGLPNYRLVRYADLCRTRHRSHYAVRWVMPTAEAECPGGASEGSGTIGITGRLASERFAELQWEPGLL
jgi:RNA-directed DNA polymerase